MSSFSAEAWRVAERMINMHTADMDQMISCLQRAKQIRRDGGEMEYPNEGDDIVQILASQLTRLGVRKKE